MKRATRRAKVATRRADFMKRATQGADGANQNASLNLGAVLKGAITRHNVILYYSTKSNSPEISPTAKTTLLLPGVGNELPRNFVKINAWDVSLSRRGDAESTRESTQGGGHWQLGLPVQRGDLRIARGRSRTSSRVMPRAFSRTKDGSRGCSLSRDSNIGTQENSRIPEFARIRVGGSCGLTGALAPWSERRYRSGRV